MQNLPENFPKIFKIYFNNMFSMENDFLDHAAFTNFFLGPGPGTAGFPAGIPADDIRRSPAPKIPLYYSADPDSRQNPSQVTDPS